MKLARPTEAKGETKGDFASTLHSRGYVAGYSGHLPGKQVCNEAIVRVVGLRMEQISLRCILYNEWVTPIMHDNYFASNCCWVTNGSFLKNTSCLYSI